MAMTRFFQNARAIFESHLDAVFSGRAFSWLDRSVDELVDEGALLKPFDGNHGELHPTRADYALSGFSAAPSRKRQDTSRSKG